MNRLNNMQTYLRLFLLISIVFIMLVIPFTVTVSSQFSRYAYNEIERFSGDRLGQTLENTEFIFQKLKNYGLRMYEDPALKNWMLSDQEQGLIQTEARSALSQFVAFEPFISKVYLFNFQTERVFDSHDGLVTFVDFDDQSMLGQVSDSKFDVLRYFFHMAEGQSYLALRYPSNSRITNTGYLVILLDTMLLKNYLLQSDSETGVQVVILDKDGRSVLGDTEAFLPNLLSTAAAPCMEPFRFRQGDDSWIVNCSDIKLQDWSIYYLTHMNDWEQKVISFQRFVVVGALLITLALLVFLFWNLRKHVHPFSRIAVELGNKLKGKYGGLAHKGGDRQMIERGIELLVSRVDDISHSMRDHQVLIKEEYLRQWILSGKLSSGNREHMEKQSRLLGKKHVNVAVLRIEWYKAFAATNSFTSRKLIKYAMGNITEEFSRRHSLAADSVDMGGDHIVVLLGSNEADVMLPVQVLELAQEQIQMLLRLPSVAAVSDSRRLEDDIRFAYEHVLELTMLKFVSGDHRVYVEDDYESYVKMIEPLSIDAELERLIQAVQAGKPEQADKLLDHIVREMLTLSYQECRVQLTFILYTLTRSFHQIMERSPAKSIQALLEQFDTLQEARNWLSAELHQISEPREGGDESADRKREIAREVEEYIRGRLHDPMLNAEQIAGHIALSVRWIRQTFKEVRGATVADYILSLRIENVKRLLTCSSLTVAEIAEQSGFLTKSHFFAAFKKASGLTPNEYRQLTKTAEDRHHN